MKTLLVSLILCMSSISYASEYRGLDAEGNDCSIKLTPKEDGTTAVSAMTKMIWPQLFGAPAILRNSKLEVSNTFIQGNQSGTLITTDKVLVEFNGDRPDQFKVTRKTKLKTGWFKISKSEKHEVNCKLI